MKIKKNKPLIFLILSLLLLGLYIISRDKSPIFENTIDTSGITRVSNSKGVLFADFDNDGLTDVVLLGPDSGSVIYTNLGSGAVKDVTGESGFGFEGDIWGGTFGDFDNDGCRDLYVARSGSRDEVGETDKLYRNNCDGTFSDVSQKSGIFDGYHGRGVALADYNGDGFLDIYVANHGPWNTSVDEPNLLYRNNGDFTFSEVAEEANLLGFADCPGLDFQKQSFQPVWFDYNRDNLIDLFVATDTYMSPLFKNNGDGTFEDVTEEVGMCVQGTAMGATVGDYDNDGDFDLYVTNTGQNFFWRNTEEGFEEVSEEAGVADALSLGWGTLFLDYDNDGHLDLYVANGNVAGGPEGNKEVANKMEDKLYRNLGDGSFQEVSQKEGVAGDFWKEGASFGDMDGNGFLDIFVTSPLIEGQNSRHKFYLNKGNSNNWIAVKLAGTKSNRDAVGSVIEVETNGERQHRVVTAGSSYLSQTPLTQFFGLGSSKRVDKIKVMWPSGKTTFLENVRANKKIVIEER